ncbi:MAG: SDR family NAD(P)-dependent oxidoreductase [Rhodobacteraceae bacterium]|nr:SDR family NAD(P)-dependent oxidoreductase [Paracoccaceae bacterium]
MKLDAEFRDLKGKTVLITGGGSGIGAALTEGFIMQGAKVAFLQRSDATEFCDRLEARHNVRPLSFQCDLTDIEALRRVVREAAAALGPIAVLVNNAANDVRHATEELTVEEWDANHAVNLRPYFFGCQAVIPGMRELGGGAIINFTSISYIMGGGGYPAYTTANAGITGLTRSLAREYGAEKIRVNALAPGWVLTDKQLRLWAKPDLLAEHMKLQRLKEHLQPEDIVSGCLFLASNASRMMTGQVLAIDGGVTVNG